MYYTYILIENYEPSEKSKAVSVSFVYVIKDIGQRYRLYRCMITRCLVLIIGSTLKR